MSQKEKLSVRDFVARCGGTYQRLCYVAAGIIGQVDGAEDIVQQAFAIGVEKDLGFENEPQLIAWLSGVVRRCALNDRRKVQRRKTQSTDPVILSNITTQESGLQPTESEAVRLTDHQTSFDDEVVNALKQLSPDARACLLLRTIEQLSYREIASLMNMPEGTALSLVHRGRKKMRELLADKEVSFKGGRRERQ